MVIGEDWTRQIKIAFFISDQVNLRNIAALVDDCRYPSHYDKFPDGVGTSIEGIRLPAEPDDDIPF